MRLDSPQTNATRRGAREEAYRRVRDFGMAREEPSSTKSNNFNRVGTCKASGLQGQRHRKWICLRSEGALHCSREVKHQTRFLLSSQNDLYPTQKQTGD